jgi:hypothetical protein
MRHIAGAKSVRQAQNVGFANAHGLTRLGKGEKESKDRRALRAPLRRSERKHFSFVNESSRRLCCSAVESRGVARRGRVR